MKKNIAFQMFLTALFSFTVFFGCTGEESGHVSGIGDEDMKLQSENSNELGAKEETVTWEEKIYCNHTIDEDFDGYTVLVVMDRNTGGINKKHEKSFFGGIEIESIRDLTAFAENDAIDSMLIDWEKWRQILSIKLPGDSKENVLYAISVLEKIDGIKSVCPNHYERPSVDINFAEVTE